MNYWERLTSEEAHSIYNIDAQFAFDNRNRFYAGQYRPDKYPYEGPFPFIAIINHLHMPVASLYVATIEEEEFELDTEHNPYNPLISQGFRLLRLNLDECEELIEILRQFAHTMPPVGYKTNEIFRLLENDDLPFIADSYATQVSNQHFYSYEADPLGQTEHKHAITIIGITYSKAMPLQVIGFSIRHLDNRHLEVEKPQQMQMIYHSKAKFSMDQKGFLALAQLLETRLGSLKSP